jgi:hypothetical protein
MLVAIASEFTQPHSFLGAGALQIQEDGTQPHTYSISTYLAEGRMTLGGVIIAGEFMGELNIWRRKLDENGAPAWEKVWAIYQPPYEPPFLLKNEKKRMLDIEGPRYREVAFAIGLTLITALLEEKTLHHSQS